MVKGLTPLKMINECMRSLFFFLTYGFDIWISPHLTFVILSFFLLMIFFSHQNEISSCVTNSLYVVIPTTAPKNSLRNKFDIV